MQLPRLKRGTGGIKKTLGREIALTLAVKLLLLYGLWYVFFSHPALHSMIEGMNPDRVAAKLITAPK
ncbi:MAG: cytochrome oxidase putative small subunit CydP [Sideroxyarcus sp.]